MQTFTHIYISYFQPLRGKIPIAMSIFSFQISEPKYHQKESGFGETAHSRAETGKI